MCPRPYRYTIKSSMVDLSSSLDSPKQRLKAKVPRKSKTLK